MQKAPIPGFSSWTGAPGEFRPPKYASPQPCYPDGRPWPTAGRLQGRWIEKYLVHGEGDALADPIRLPLFFWYILNRLYEFNPETGQLAHDRALILIAKGNNKTEGVADIGLAELMGPVAPVVSPRVVVSAASYDQTMELFAAARLAITGDPAHDKPGPLSSYFREGDHLREDRILLPGGVGRLERIAAVGGTNDGGKPTAHLGDEVHEWNTERKERVFTVQGKSLRKRRVIRKTPASLGLPAGVSLWGSLQAAISTAGFSLDSLLGRLYLHGVEVAEGRIQDPGFLFLCWEADEHWDLDDYAERTQAILQANPAIGSFLPLENVHASYLDPTVPRHEFLRYNLDRWPGDALAWIPRAMWGERAGDVSMRPELPTFAVVTVAHDHRSAAVAIAQRQGGTIALQVRTFPDGHLPDGEFVPVSDLESYLRGLHRAYPAKVLAPKRFHPRGKEYLRPQQGPEIVYHGAFFEGSVQKLRPEGLVFVDVPDTHERLAPASESLKAAALEGRLRHDGDLELARQIGGVLAAAAARGWTIREAGPAARAAMVAVHRALTAPEPGSRVAHRAQPKVQRGVPR